MTLGLDAVLTTAAVAVALSCAVAAILALRHARDAERRTARHRAVTLASIGEAVIVTGADDRITFMNGEAVRLTGWTAEAALGAPLERVFATLDEASRLPAPGPAACVRSDPRIVRSVDPTVLVARDGIEHVVEWTASPIREPDGTVEGIALVFRDCTGRRESEAELRRRLTFQEEMSRLAESVPGVLHAFRRSAGGHCSFPSSSASILALYGFGSRRLAEDAAPVFERIHPEDRERVAAAIEVSARTLAPWEGEFRYQHPALGLRWIEGHSVPRPEADGSVVWYGFVHDVTERKRLEQGEREQRRRVAAFVEHSPAVMFAKDGGGRYVLASPRLLALFGATGGITGKTDLDLLPEATARSWQSNDAIVRETGRPHAFEEALVVEGRERRYYVHKFPLFDDAGAVEHVCGIAIDVTEASDAAAALEASEARMRTLADAAFEGLAFHEHGVLVDVNDQIARMYGYLREEMIGRSILDFVAPECRPDIAAMMEAGLPSDSCTWSALRKDGSTFVAESRGRTTSIGDREVRAVAVRDITETRRAEASMRASELLFRNVFNQQFQLMAILEPDGRVRELNDSALALAGCGREAVIGRAIWDIPGWTGLPVWKDVWSDRLARAAASDRTVFTEDVLDAPEGPTRYADSATTAVRDEHGRLQYFILQAQETTARRNAEEGLRESEAHHRSLLAALADGVFVAQDHRFVFSNPALPAMLGYEAAEFVGLPFERVIAPDFLPLWTARYDARVGGGPEPQRQYDVCFMRRDGQRLWVELRASRVQFKGRAAVLGIIRDISDRKASEAALRESEGRLQFALDGADMGVWEWDVRNDDVFWSRRCAAIFGLTETDVNIEGFSRLVHPEDRAVVLARTRKAIEDHVPYAADYRVIHPDGQTRWVRSRGVLRYDDAGEPLRLVGTVMDVTDRKRADDALRESERRLDHALAAIGQAVWDWDLRTNRVRHNSIWCNRLGLDDSHLEHDMSFFEALVHPEDRPAILKALTTCLNARVPYRAEYRMRRADGEYIWVLDRGDVVERDTDGRPLRVVGSFADITERRALDAELERHRQHLAQLVAERTAQLQEANRALEERSERVADLYNRAPCGYHSLDPEGFFVSVNDTELAWLGYTREDLVGRVRLVDLVAPHDRERIARNFELRRTAGIVRDEEFELVCKDGSRLPVVCNATIVRDAAGSFLATRGTLFDNRERKAREDEIAALNEALERRAGEAEAANRAKSAFLANMSHEIRTPMNAIVGLTNILQMETRDERQLDRLHKVSDAAEHLMAIINDILDISKIEAGKLVLETSDFDLEPLLESGCALIAERARAKGLELVLSVDPRLLRVVRGDPTRLSQVILNYASNAVKFTERGAITLRAELAEETENDLLVRIAVDDTGIGIPSADVGRIFKAFEQADGSTTRRYGGTGLGLTINRRLAAMMGGDVGVTSEVGRGSTFWFTARFGKVGEPDLSRTAPSLAGRRALVCDDLPEARLAVTALLRMFGMRVVATDSGESAIAAFEQAGVERDPIEVVFMDWRMPDMDGLAAAERILAARPERPVHVFMLTAFDEPALREGAERVKAGVLIKPLTSSSLQEALASVLGRANVAIRAAVEAPALEGLAPEQRDNRVLLVEDNPVNQEVALSLLTALGLHVDVADSGTRAVELARNQAYDLILMDVQLPGLDGMAATRAIRGFSGGPRTPIVAMTANAFEEHRRECLDAGMDDHVGKPVDLGRLVAALSRWLPRKPVRRGGVPAPSMRPLRVTQEAWKAFAQLPGVDARHGLQRVAGDPARYSEVLALFADSAYQDIESIARLVETQHWTEARQRAHYVRGGASTIGAMEIDALLEAVEEEIDHGRNRERLDDLIASALQQHRSLAAALRASDAPKAGEPTGTSPFAARADLLDRLEALLAADDAAANELVRDSRAALVAALGPVAAAVENLVERFDYPGALERLRAAREQAEPTDKAA